ncbi:MAG: hypothetical protein ACI97A_003742 [Planctomycetota bacterium]|jgi:hypothetical protein
MDKIYLFTAVVGGALFIIQFVMMLIGMGNLDADGGDVDLGDSDGVAIDGDMEADGDGDGLATFGQISFRTLVAFFMFFGLGGLWAESVGSSPTITIMAALGGGLFAFYVVSWVMRKFASLTSSGNIDIRNAVGVRGRVYLPVEAERGGMGKITITVQGRTVQIGAVTDGGALSTGVPCTVTGVLDRETLVIKSLVEEESVNA